jgi:hypothetical protein
MKRGSRAVYRLEPCGRREQHDVESLKQRSGGDLRMPNPSFFLRQICALERLQEHIMQAKFERAKAALRTSSAGLSIAILASTSLIAALALCAPDRALAACGASSCPAGVHAAGG